MRKPDGYKFPYDIDGTDGAIILFVGVNASEEVKDIPRVNEALTRTGSKPTSERGTYK